MTTKSLLLLVMVSATYAHAQDWPPPIDPPPIPVIPTKHIVLPDEPTVQDFADLFVQSEFAQIDPIELLGVISAKGSPCVPGLVELLFSDSLLGSTSSVGFTSTDSVLKKTNVPKKIYAVYALEAIKSPECLSVFERAATNHREPEVRGACLNILAHSCYDRVRNGELKADKEIVHILLMNADDSTTVGPQGQSLGDLARLGLMRWMGHDYGILKRIDSEIAVGKDKRMMRLKDYREYWWSTKSSALSWNEQRGQFELSH